MGDYFTMLADTEVALDRAPSVSATVIAELQSRGIIASEFNTDDSNVANGYLPGGKIGEIYDPARAGNNFWGGAVEPKTERHFNYWAYGPSYCGLTCPKCSTAFDESMDAFRDTVGDVIGKWMEESGRALLPCPACAQETWLPDWHAKNPFAFCNFSLTFWNWPPFDRPEWLLDIPGLLRDITGHTIVSSFGKV